MVLLTGASGFVGGRLLSALRETASLRCLVRDASRLREADRALAVEADLDDPASLVPALEGVDELYYVHSMEPGGGQSFAERDRAAAENYVRIARVAGSGARFIAEESAARAKAASISHRDGRSKPCSPTQAQSPSRCGRR